MPVIPAAQESSVLCFISRTVREPSRLRLLVYGWVGVRKTWCLTSTETMRLIRDGEKGRGAEGGMEMVEEGNYNYTYRYAAVTTRVTSALRWASMRAILMFHNYEGQSHKTVSTDHNLMMLLMMMIAFI